MTKEVYTVPLDSVVELTRQFAGVLNSLADSIEQTDFGVPTHEAPAAPGGPAAAPVAEKKPAAEEKPKKKRTRRTKAQIEAEAQLAAEAMAPKKEEPAAEAEVLEPAKEESPKEQDDTTAGVDFSDDMTEDEFKKAAMELTAIGGKADSKFAQTVIPKLMGKFSAGKVGDVFEKGEYYEFLCDLEREVLDAQKKAA